MKVTSVKTDKILPGGATLTEMLDKHLDKLAEGNVLAVTSKVVALCENRVVPTDKAEKNDLVIGEADYYLPSNLSKYGFSFTILHNTLVPAAGIDLSNAAGNYVLWPANPQKSANEIREYLVKRFKLKNVGVVITDSTARPLHYGTEGIAISYSGFLSSNNYVGQPDLFDRRLEVSVSNIVDALAASAVVVMGEGDEQTPLAIIEDLPFVQFQNRNPSKEELERFFIDHMKDDLFEPLLKNADWKKGGQGYKHGMPPR
jgi:putative folate metabolism gamma-glutamate ligase